MKIGKYGISSGRDETPGRTIIYGPGSVGKTTLACSAPAPIVLSMEDGARELGVPCITLDAGGRVVPQNLDEVRGVLDALASGDMGDRRTLVIDGLHQLDVLVHEAVCKANPKWKSIQTAGFGVGESEVLSFWRPLVARLEEINRKQKMRIVATAHSQIVNFKDPEGPEYGRHDIAVTKHPKGDVAAFLFGWADACGFTTFERLTQDIGPSGRQRTVAVSSQGERLMHLAWTTAYQAKCRLSGAPDTIKLSNEDGSPKGWDDVFGPFESKAPALMRAEIAKLLEHVDEAQRKAGTAWLATVGDNVPALARSLEKLRNGMAVKKNEEKGAAA